MGCCTCNPICLTLLPILLGLCVYFAHTPFPEHVHNPWLKSAIGFAQRMIQSSADGLERLGFGDNIYVQRWFVSLCYSLDFSQDLGTTREIRMIEEVEVWIFRPKPSISKNRLLPGVIFLHGGGWVYGSAGNYQYTTRLISNVSEAIVISVNYRLAPENTFPLPYEDALAVTQYVLKYGRELGVDTNRVAIAGHSAGANLAMAVALTLSNTPETDLPRLKLLGLFSAFLQGLDFNLPSHNLHAYGSGVLKKQDLVDFWTYYIFGSRSLAKEFSVNNHTSAFMKDQYSVYVSQHLPMQSRQRETNTHENKEGNHFLLNRLDYSVLLDYRLNPLLSLDDQLLGLPLTYIFVTEFDPLRDDSLILAERMRKIGHPVELCYDDGEDHMVYFISYLTQHAHDQVEHFALYLRKHFDGLVQ